MGTTKADMQYCPECGINSTAGARVLRGEKGATAALRIELTAAIEREQALAAHVKGIKTLFKSTDVELPSKWQSEMYALFSQAPTTTLAKRDLIKQAEALEESASKCELAVQAESMRMHLRSHADKLRQQAAAL